MHGGPRKGEREITTGQWEKRGCSQGRFIVVGIEIQSLIIIIIQEHTLAQLVSSVGCHPFQRKVSDLIPSQFASPSVSPERGVKKTTDLCLSLSSSLFLSPNPQKNKIIF